MTSTVFKGFFSWKLRDELVIKKVSFVEKRSLLRPRLDTI